MLPNANMKQSLPLIVNESDNVYYFNTRDIIVLHTTKETVLYHKDERINQVLQYSGNVEQNLKEYCYDNNMDINEIMIQEDTTYIISITLSNGIVHTFKSKNKFLGELNENNHLIIPYVYES